MSRTGRASRAGLGALVLFALVRAATPGEVRAMAPEPPPDGGIRIDAAALRPVADVWRLDARAGIELPAAIRAGLDSGVPLEFVLEVTLREPRRLAPDRVLLDVDRRYGLVYYELTRHYRVRSLDDGTGRNYRSLGTALEGLGTLDDVPLGAVGTELPSHDPAERGRVERGPRVGGPRVGGPDGAGRLVARIALRLDGRALPLPLQSPFGSAWRLAGRPLLWTLPRGGDPADANAGVGARRPGFGDEGGGFPDREHRS